LERTENEGLHNLYASPYIIRMIKLKRMRWAGRDEKCIQNFGWEIRREETTRKTRRRGDNIRVDFRETGRGIVD
jgi:hypothetical protein